MSQFSQDLRYGARILFKTPGVTLVAVVALALGIGANTVMFTGVNAILLSPLPFEGLDRIVRVWDTDLKHGATRLMVSGADFLEWRDQSKSFEDIAAYRDWSVNLTGVDDPERLQGCAVLPSFFGVLGMPPQMGRVFSPSEEQPGNDQVVVISYGLWKRRFAADSKIVGKSLLLNGNPYVVTGVMPPDFDYPLGTEVWKPLAVDGRNNRNARNLFVLARLKQDVSIGQARAEMSAIARRLARQYPVTNAYHGVRIRPVRESINKTPGRFVLILMTAAGFVLLLACANVANIQLARMTSRRKEMAVRATLGASRWRIGRQILVESLLLTGLGAGLALVVAVWGVDLTRASIPAQVYKWIHGLRHMELDGTVLAFTVGIATLASLLCGAVPALQVSRRNLSETLKEGGRSTALTGEQRSLRNPLVVAEVALALVLLVGAGLMVKVFRQVMSFDVGFNPQNLLTMSISLPGTKYREPDSIRAFYDRVLEQLRARPEVESAGATNSGSAAMQDFRIEGHPAPPLGESLPGVELVSSGYFAAMDIPVLRGRPILAQDGAAKGAPVAVISETVFHRYWQELEDPIGARIHIGGYGFPPLTVVGVAGDLKDWFSGERQPVVYLPDALTPEPSMMLVIRTRGDPTTFAGAARAQIASVDRDLPVYDVKTMEQSLNEQTSGVRLSAQMMGVFAVIALLLAATGIYGVMSYSVAQRSHDIGVRMALGAEAKDVLRLVLGQALKLAATGLAIGAGAAFALTRLMSSVLYGVVALDVFTFASFAFLLCGTALLAGYIPARRATKAGPMKALRYE